MNNTSKYITNISLINVATQLCGQPGILKYERFKSIPILPELNNNIPKIIHFVWIGSPIPYMYVVNLLTFVATNKERYVYKLWVDHKTPPIEGVLIYDIRTNFPGGNFINKEIYDIETNWGAKADILKYELVYHEGGIYTDVDAISVKAFDENFEKAFVAYAEEPYNDVGTCVFGFPSGSRYLKFVMDCLKEVRTYNFDYASLPTKLRVCLLTGPIIFRQCFEFYNDPSIQMINQEILSLGKDNPDAYSYHTFDSMWWDKNRIS